MSLSGYRKFAVNNLIVVPGAMMPVSLLLFTPCAHAGMLTGTAIQTNAFTTTSVINDVPVGACIHSHGGFPLQGGGGIGIQFRRTQITGTGGTDDCPF